MKHEDILLATFTFPHEAIFLESLLKEKGIKTRVHCHPPIIQNHFYKHPENVKSIFISPPDINKALEIIRSIKCDMHITNRYTLFHEMELMKDTQPLPEEKGFCWFCYTLMFSSLGVLIYAIAHSLQMAY